MYKTLILLSAAFLLGGCSSLGKEFNNQLVCTPDGKAFFVSMYGPLGVASKIDSAVICAQGEKK